MTLLDSLRKLCGRRYLLTDGRQGWISVAEKITPRRTGLSPVRSADVRNRVTESTPAPHFSQPSTPAVEPTSRTTSLVAPAVVPPAPQPARSPATSPAGPALTPPRHDFSDLVCTPRHTFRHLVGMDDTKKRLLRAGHAILGGAERNGILLFGEPGNGKSLFAEALAGDLGVPFLPMAFGDTASKWINETPEKIRDVFFTARRLGACVLFLDEADSLLKPRDGSASIHSMDRDMVNTLLKEIVALRGLPVVLVAATNFVEQLDTAAVRTGRFDFHVEVPPPDLPARRTLIWRSIVALLGREAIPIEVLDSLARRWSGFSAARLVALGPQLAEMHQDGLFDGQVDFDLAMRAMRLIQGQAATVPENVKRIRDILMPAASRNALTDLALQLHDAYDFELLGGTLPRGLLFEGPPGTGKTAAAMALAKACGYAFLPVTGADLLARPDAWTRLVCRAKDLRPAIVFIDEAESVLADRRHSGVSALTNRILTSIDGTDGRVPDVIYIAATNHPDMLDPAVVRGGRFATRIHFDVPEASGMAAYVMAVLQQKSAERSFWMEDGTAELAAQLLAGRSIADADALVAEAINLGATRLLYGCDDGFTVCQSEIRAAAETILSIDTGAR